MQNVQSMLSTASSFTEELYASLRMDARQFDQTKIPLDKLKTHGTTIGMLRVDNGERLIAFSDGKMTVGDMAFGSKMDKVMQVDDHTCLLISGSATMGIRLAHSLRSYIAIRENTDHRLLPASAKVNFLVGALAQMFPMAAQGMGVVPLMATFDRAHSQEGRLYLFTMDGSVAPINTCKVYGSGFTPGNGALEILYDEEVHTNGFVGLAKGIDFTHRILEKTTTDDNHSGGSWTIKIIDKDGVHTVEEDSHGQR